MVNRNIPVTEEVYQKLVQMKKEDETFNDLLKRLYQESDNLTILKKLQGTLNIPEKDKLIDEIYQKRREPHDSPWYRRTHRDTSKRQQKRKTSNKNHRGRRKPPSLTKTETTAPEHINAQEMATMNKKDQPPETGSAQTSNPFLTY